jgi:hypothetical protein
MMFLGKMSGTVIATNIPASTLGDRFTHALAHSSLPLSAPAADIPVGARVPLRTARAGLSFAYHAANEFRLMKIYSRIIS